MSFLGALKDLAPVVGDLGGSLLGGMFGQSSADKQMEFQKFMSNTAHQREVRDLRLAGLNPILSAGGPGAAASSGASASMSAPSLGTSYSNAASARVARQTAELEQELLGAQVAKTKAETLNVGQDFRLKSQDELLRGLDMQLKQFDIGNLPSLHASARASEASTRALQSKQIEEIEQLMKADAANRELQDWGGEALKKLRNGTEINFSDLLGLGGHAFKQVLDALLPSGKAVYGRGVRR